MQMNTSKDSPTSLTESDSLISRPTDILGNPTNDEGSLDQTDKQSDQENRE